MAYTALINTNNMENGKMKAIVTNKATGAKYEASARKEAGKWIIGGDVPEWKVCHYSIVYDDGREYSLRNGRMVAA